MKQLHWLMLLPAGASPYGCLDMVGNVCQWCADWYDEHYYTYSPSQNPTGPATGKTRVRRGIWCCTADYAVCTAVGRLEGAPSDQLVNGGFRCVVHASGPPIRKE